jgi:magnesium transporter
MATQSKTVSDKTSINIVTYGDFTWVDIVEPGATARKYLEDNFKFNPLDLDDCFSPRQLSKIDEYQQYLFVIFHLPTYDKATRVSTIHQWSAFVSDKYLVTLRPESLESLDDLRQEIGVNEDAKRSYLDQGSGYVLYSMLDRAVDAYFATLDKIMTQINVLEDKVFDDEIEAAKDISSLRRDILTQRRVMFPERTLLLDLENKLKRFAKTNLSVLYGDLMDHMNKICETLDAGKEIIEVFKDADFVLSSYRANRIIRYLAILFSVALPFLIIAGLYSMRGIFPWILAPGSIAELIVFGLIIVLAIIGILSLLRKMRLI